MVNSMHQFAALIAQRLSRSLPIVLAALVSLCLCGGLASIPATAQNSYVVYLAGTGAGNCTPYVEGGWSTFEAAAAAEFQACAGPGGSFSPQGSYYSWLGVCVPSGAPNSVTVQEIASCPVYASYYAYGPVAGISAWAQVQSSGLFWTQASSKSHCPRDPVGPDPIDPSAGNVFECDTDGYFSGTSSPIRFKRYYNSIASNGTDFGPGWQHSYGQSVYVITQWMPTTPYPPITMTYSPQYSSAAEACTSGFAAIQSAVPAWAEASTSYTANDICVISNSSGPIGTLPIYSAYSTVAASAAIEYDVIRANGDIYRFTAQNGSVVSPPGVGLSFAVTSSGFTVTDDDDNIETYNSNGVLQSITSRAGVVQTMTYNSAGSLGGVADSFGNSLTINRNSSNQISSIAFGSAGTVQYSYDSSQRLSQVTNLDGTTVSYLYGNASFPNALTGKVDENGTQFLSWGYDSLERGTSNSMAGAAMNTSVSYNSDGTVTVTDALGAARTFTYTRIGDFNETTSISGSQCPTCGDSAATTYDASGWVSSSTDYNGNLTCYQHDAVRGLELVRIEGFAPGSTCPSGLSTYTPQSGTLQRKITTQWNSSWREPSQITEPTRTTSFTFDGSGNVLTKTVTDTTVTPNVSRTWTYTYNSYGQVLTAQGPRTDVNSTTTYVYYTCSSGWQCGQVQTITNALGQVRRFNTYNAYGQPLTITDPNGIVSKLAYNSREQLTSSQVGTETTSYSYYSTGLPDTVTLPDSSTIQYSYDSAHRLTQITDGVGNYITYTLDAMGNRTAEGSYDPAGVLHRAHTRTFNILSELYKEINAANTSAVTTTYGYDSNSNQTSSAAPLSRNTANLYDVLNRLSQVTDSNSGVTQIGYDASDNLAWVSDPRSLTTAYSHDGFNDLTQLSSPDTGTTSYTYDLDGNLKTATDARGAVASFAYDALNRLTQMAYSDDNIAFTYDSGTFGIGRLTSASDANHSLAWTYDGRGRVTGKGQTVASITKSVGYAYSNGDLTSLVTPSGQTVTYSYTNHQITSIWINGSMLLSGVTYDPFGPANGWSWGNNTTVSRAYDEDGNPTQIVTAGVTNSYTVDNASRIIGISDSGLSSNSWSFGYDALDRITSGSSSASSRGYTYNGDGNVLTETGTVAFTAAVARSSNQLTAVNGDIARSYSYDAAGDITGDGANSYTFNQRGRMSSATTTGGTTNYPYNALGRLIEKSGNGGTTLFMYDEAGHLLGEYSSSGALIEETVWMGDIPVATIQPSGSSLAVYYIHTDHLGTARKITRPSDNGLMWRWDPDTFGSVTPNTNPAGLGTFTYRLGFPGQYYLPESGLYYNYFRDYDSQMGRYVESDPIGLNGGINTYSYVRNNPISRSDPRGLYDCTYSISAHSMNCIPDLPGDPNFSSTNYVSGNNNLNSCHS